MKTTLTSISKAISILICMGLTLVVATSAHATTRNYSTSSFTASSTLSLDNLERERAAFIHDLLDVSLDHQTRLQALGKRQRTLVDMERMVMRDERLVNDASHHVQRAFADYESTFLVHAGAETNKTASEQWLANIKLNNQAIMQATPGFRK